MKSTTANRSAQHPATKRLRLSLGASALGAAEYRRNLPPRGAAAAALCVLFLSACLLDNRRAGAEDFPNTMEPLGKIAAEDWQSQGDWEQFSDRPQPAAESGSDSLVGALPDVAVALEAALPALPRAGAFTPTASPEGDASGSGGAGLAKTGAVSVGLFIDSAAGTATLVRVDDAVLKIQSDTLVFALGDLWDDPLRRGEALRSLRGSQAQKVSARRLDYLARDENEDGRLDWGRFVSVLPGLGENVREEIAVYTAGSDGALGGGDDALVLHAHLRLAGPDTLESVWTRDADGDSVLFRADGSGKVRVERFVRNPLLRPRVDWARQTYLVTAFADGGDPVPLRFREEREMADGSAVLVQAHGIGADSTLNPGDTARVRVETDFPEGAGRLSRKAVFTAVVGEDARRFGDWRMLRYAIESELASGPLASVAFSARLDAPGEPGQLRAEGEFTLRANLRGGGSAVLEGALRNRRLEASLVVEGADGEGRYEAVWDEAGALLERRRKD